MPQHTRTQRLVDDIHSLARITDPQIPYTRRCFSPEYVAGRRWLTEQFQAAGLHVSLDAGANLIGRLPGSNDHRAPIMIGSHIDTVTGGGRFDGIAGVLIGLEVARSLQEHGVELQHPLEIVDFLGEEPNDFGSSCVGSQAMVGTLTPELLAATHPSGQTLAAAIEQVGGQSDVLRGPLRPPGSVAAFLELHIEQGRVLEEQDVPIGIVTDIVGIRRFRVMVTGQPDHAGTTPMPLRKDALVGAAWLIQEIHRRALDHPADPALVATVGKISVQPNASNVVPGSVELIFEVRSPSNAAIENFAGTVLDAAREHMAALDLTLDATGLTDSAPTPCSHQVQEILRQACGQAAVPFLQLPSGAGHDAAHMARIAPMGMLFIPCREGRSHNPDEWASPEHLSAGAEVVYQAVVALDRAGQAGPER